MTRYGTRPCSPRTATACWRPTWRKRFCREWWSKRRPRVLTSDDHFTVDGTLLEAWAGAKSFQPKAGKSSPPSDDDPGNPTVNTATHEAACVLVHQGAD